MTIYFILDFYRNLLDGCELFVFIYILYIYFYFLVTCRLLSKNRQDEALVILKNVAKANKRELSMETWNGLLETHFKSKGDKHVQETIKDAVKSPVLCVMSCILFLNWLVGANQAYSFMILNNYIF